MYTHPQDVLYYPEGPRIEYASPEEAIAAYVEVHFPGSGPHKKCDAINSAGYPYAVEFVAANGVKHGIYLERSGDKWIVAATSKVVPPEHLTPNLLGQEVAKAVHAGVAGSDISQIPNAYIDADADTLLADCNFRIIKAN
ncbi:MULTISPECIES: hypothetical protein [Ralstonia]|uniref:Uncharacterized protein n=2 Tax=Ralstonia TaxID=48736 RepID=A0AAD2F3K1_9RALS|nr:MULTISPECIES: hypothetical protein [Ralstonia]NMV39939.1 hypothetical protein [Ralstonia insidiosa]CAJ0807619.1 hypothetical protein R77560_04601 [Ralstonia sp. LMG 18095]